jgi:hypothetical protein
MTLFRSITSRQTECLEVMRGSGAAKKEQLPQDFRGDVAFVPNCDIPTPAPADLGDFLPAGP